MKGWESYQNGWRQDCCQGTLHHCVLKKKSQERDGPLLTSDLHVSAVAQCPSPVSSKIYYISLNTRSCCAHTNSAPTCSTAACGRSLPRWKEPAWGWGGHRLPVKGYVLYPVLSGGGVARLLGLWSVTQVNEAGLFTDTGSTSCSSLDSIPSEMELDTNSTHLRARMRTL